MAKGNTQIARSCSFLMKVKCVTKQHYNEVAYMFGTDPHKCHIMMLIVE